MAWLGKIFQIAIRNKKIILQVGVALYQNRKTIIFYYKKWFRKNKVK